MSSVERDRALPEVGTRELLDFLRAYRASGAFGRGPVISPLPPARASSGAEAVGAVGAGGAAEAADCGRAGRSPRSRRRLARVFIRRRP